jgi:Zn-dependent protease
LTLRVHAARNLLFSGISNLGMDIEKLLAVGLNLIPLLLSLSFHEYAHGWTARHLGDDTAERLGRLTLNPLAHIDPLGTIVLPLMLMVTGAPVFGWAKPVPVDPARFRRDVNMNRGMMLTSAAGPLSNFLLAAATAIVWGALARFAPGAVADGQGALKLIILMLTLNVTLGVFNLIPLPPLDGSRVVEGILPFRMRPAWERFAQVAPFILLAMLFLPGGILGRILAPPSNYVLTLLLRLANAIA